MQLSECLALAVGQRLLLGVALVLRWVLKIRFRSVDQYARGRRSVDRPCAVVYRVGVRQRWPYHPVMIYRPWCPERRVWKR